MAKGTQAQFHDITLETGGIETITINRNGNHQYWVGDGPKMSGVTTQLYHLDGNMFPIGMGWAIKQVRLADGDMEKRLGAPKRIGDAAIATGTYLHEGMENFIATGKIDEENYLLTTLLQGVGQRDWIATEQFLYHPEYKYGGTADAFSQEPGGIALWDWKTKDAESFAKYGPGIKDMAQASAYVMALRAMGSVLAPDMAYICYIMRDGSTVDVVPVEIDRGWELFKAANHIHTLLKDK
jgi:hypothetical protein